MAYNVYMRKKYLLLIIVTFLSVFTLVQAQLFDFGLDKLDQNLSIEIIPTIPKPRSPLQINIESYSFNLNEANISWLVNGELVQKGVGIKTIKLVAGDPGQKISVGINVSSPVAGTFSKSLTIIPQDVNILWESAGYVPPFYPGKSLHSYENTLTLWVVSDFTASNSVKIPPQGLTYRWKRNGQLVTSGLGVGKNSLKIKGSALEKEEKMLVEVSTNDGTLTGSSEVVIANQFPLVVFYEKDPLYGIKYQNSISDTFNLTGQKEVTLKVVPYFFGVSSPTDPSLQFSWKVNEQEIFNQGEGDTITLRNESMGSGSSLISLIVQSLDKTYQTTAGQFFIEYSGN